MKLDTFTSAYIRTALWSSTDNADESGGEPLDRNYSEDDLHQEAMADIKRDCAAFLSGNEKLIADAIAAGKVVCGPDFDEYGRAGHDFWLTRNGHGAGFWDGDWPEPFATALTDAAHAFGAQDIYVGDDGKLYI